MSEPPLRLVPKPEGFELRDKRSEKDKNPARWTPADAIYDASQRMQLYEATQLVVYWWEKREDGRERLNWANATLSHAEHAYMLQKALDALLRPPT